MDQVIPGACLEDGQHVCAEAALEDVGTECAERHAEGPEDSTERNRRRGPWKIVVERWPVGNSTILRLCRPTVPLVRRQLVLT